LLSWLSCCRLGGKRRRRMGYISQHAARPRATRQTSTWATTNSLRFLEWTQPSTILQQNGGFLWSLECIGIVVMGVRDAVAGCGHQWWEEHKRQPGVTAATTTLIQHQQMWGILFQGILGIYDAEGPKITQRPSARTWPMSSQYVYTASVNHIGSTYADRLLRHPSPLTTIVKHSRQEWNHHLIHHPLQSTAMSLCRQPAI